MHLKKRWAACLASLAVAGAVFAGSSGLAEAAAVRREVVGYQRTLPFNCSPSDQMFVLDAFNSDPKTNCGGIAVTTGGSWLTGRNAALVNGDYKAMDKSSPSSAGGIFSPTFQLEGYYRVYVGFYRTHARSRGTAWEVYPDDGKTYRFVIPEYYHPDGPSWANFGTFLFKPRKASANPTGGYLKLTNSDIASESVDAVHFEFVAPYKVEGFTAERGASRSRVLLSWEAAPYATAYQIFRTTTFRKPTKADYLGKTASRFFADTSDEVLNNPGVPYFYWIRAVTPKGASAYRGTKGWVAVAPPANLGTLPADPSGVTLTWTEPDAGAVKYRIYRKEMSTQTPVSPAEALATIDAPAALYEDVPPQADQDYFYWVESVGSSGHFSGVSLSGPVTGGMMLP